MGQPKWIATILSQSISWRRWLILASGFFLLGVTYQKSVAAHGYLAEPQSRDAEHLKGDVKGYPIAGLPQYLSKPPCLTLPANKYFADIRPGPLRLNFVYGDGANHVGLCRVFLLIPRILPIRLKSGR